MTNAQFIQLFHLGFINSDGQPNYEKVNDSAEVYADVLMMYMQERMDDLEEMLELLKLMIRTWFHGESGDFALLYSSIYEEELELYDNTYFIELENLMNQEMYDIYVAAFLIQLTMRVIEFFIEISMEELLLEVVIGGALNEDERI
jgi:hypothetical protein